MARKLSVPEQQRTPLAQLSEAGAHAIVGYQLAQAAIVTDQVFDERVARRGGLRRVEFTILALVQGNPGVSARQLARALAVTPPNIAIWLDRLESRGLVTRERSTRDARVQQLQLTRTGTTLVKRTVQTLIEGEHAAMAALSAAERAMLIELLHKVALQRRRPD
ncbi:MAG: MarR family winged helix-turn-helix transcriptional regulator [Rhizobacter sp.]